MSFLRAPCPLTIPTSIPAHATGRPQFHASRHRGFTLLETILALGVSTTALVGLSQLEARSAARARDAAVANKMQQIYDASVQYINTNNAALMAGIPIGATTVISIGKTTAAGAVPAGPSSIPALPSIQGGGYLPSSFVDINAYSQTSRLLVQHVAAAGVTPDHLEAILTTRGGQVIRDADLSTIANKLGGIGGMMLTNPLPSVGANVIQGAFSGWQSTPATWGLNGTASMTPGHAMATFSFNSVSKLSDYLDRYQVSGLPEANKMHTNIDAGTNGIDHVGNLDTQTISNSTAGAAVTVNAPLNVNSSLNVATGGVACAGNASGCGWKISQDGGFYDNNDTWITFLGTNAGGGLKILGAGNNLVVGGNSNTIGNDTVNGNSVVLGNQNIGASQGIGLDQTVNRNQQVNGKAIIGGAGSDPLCGGGVQCSITANGGIEIRSDWLRIVNGGGVFWQNFGGGLIMSDTNWVRTYGTVGLYSAGGAVRTDVNMQAPAYFDTNNFSYVLVPSSVSNLNVVNTQKIGAAGFPGNSGYPAGYGGGVHTLDVYAEGTVALGSGGSVKAFMNNNGVAYASDYINAGNYVTAGKQMQLPPTAPLSGLCSPNGAIAANTDGSGRLMSCLNGRWEYGNSSNVSQYNLPNGANLSIGIGRHVYCALGDGYENFVNATRVLLTADYGDGTYEWSLSRGGAGNQGGIAYCIN